MNEIKGKELFLFGSGGHAKVVVATLREIGEKFSGFVLSDIDTKKNIESQKYLTESEFFENYDLNSTSIINCIGSMPMSSKRMEVSNKLRELGYEIRNCIHPSAYLSDDIIISNGVHIMAGVIIQPSTKIGRDTIINTKVSIDHDCSIGDNCHIAPGSTLSGSVNIGDNCHIGTGAVISNNIAIGSNSIIAAGSVVFKDIPPGTKFIQKK